jgi:hypothetical protein
VTARAGDTRRDARGWLLPCAGSARHQGRVPGWRTRAGAAGHPVQCLRPTIAGRRRHVR